MGVRHASVGETLSIGKDGWECGGHLARSLKGRLQDGGRGGGKRGKRDTM